MSNMPFNEVTARATCQKHNLVFIKLEPNYRVRFRCPTHGETAQNVAYIRNHGCQFCNGDYVGLNAHSLETIRAGLEDIGWEKVGPDIVDFRMEYSGQQRTITVTIDCPEHGKEERVLSSVRNSVRNKKGICTRCSAKAPKIRTHYTTESFRKAVTAANPMVYLVGLNYTKRKDNYDFFCIKDGHGPFQTSGNRALTGRGCPACAREMKRAANRQNRINAGKFSK